MPALQVLVFSLHNAHYAVEARQVREILLLPALTPVAELPPYISGLFNLRGGIVPVLDLNLRFGYPPRGYQFTDQVIVLHPDGPALGIVASLVHDVREIPDAQMEPVPDYTHRSGRERFVRALVRTDEGILMLLDTDPLLRTGAAVADLLPAAGPPAEAPPDFMAATPAEQEVLRRRAREYRRPEDDLYQEALLPVAVVTLNDEYFGIPLAVVQEFTAIRGVTPVPCCPEHILGLINLRGDLLTLIDIRPALQMPAGGRAQGETAVVVRVGDATLAVAAEQVRDVLYVHPDQVGPLPDTCTAAQAEFVRGTLAFAGQVLSLLDLPRLLTSGQG